MTKRTTQTAERVQVRSLATGMPGLDAVLGGGLPEFSFNVIAGGPGSGKTTLAQQICFRTATPERPALYFTVLGESTLKMMRYQQQFGFFDASRVGTAVQFVNLSIEALEHGPLAVYERIVHEVERIRPALVVVDGFRSLIQGADSAAPNMGIDMLMQRLALHLVSWEVTSFLIGESAESEPLGSAFRVADGVIWLSQDADRNSVVRRLQVVKMRGRAPMPGLHTFRVTDAGIEIFPRIPEQQKSRSAQRTGRHSTGVPGLDALMGGGIPVGDAVLVAGPTGSGKTTFAAHFVAEAGRAGEAAVVAVFEEYPEEYLVRLRTRDGIPEMIDDGRLKVIYLRPLDLSVDEALTEILQAVTELDASRVVIDSLSGFEVALAPAFRDDFRESLYRLVGALTATGVTVYMTAEVVLRFPELSFTNDRVSFITDDVISQRYVEIDGRLQKVVVIVKMRSSEHSQEFHSYELGPTGAVIGGRLAGYHGILTGVPTRDGTRPKDGHDGLTPSEERVLDLLVEGGVMTSDSLGARTGMPTDDIGLAIARLLALGYVESAPKVADGYRAVAQ